MSVVSSAGLSDENACARRDPVVTAVSSSGNSSEHVLPAVSAGKVKLSSVVMDGDVPGALKM